MQGSLVREVPTQEGCPVFLSLDRQPFEPIRPSIFKVALDADFIGFIFLEYLLGVFIHDYGRFPIALALLLGRCDVFMAIFGSLLFRIGFSQDYPDIW